MQRSRWLNASLIFRAEVRRPACRRHQCLVLQANVPAEAGAAQMSVDGAPPPNRLRGWSAASPEELIEVLVALGFRL